MYQSYNSASKIDFFDAENQRKLDLSKRKIMRDIGVIPSARKESYVGFKNKCSLGVEIQSLINKYLMKKELKENEEENYMVIGA